MTQEKQYLKYKTYFFGLIKVKNGWRDLGETGSFDRGGYKTVSVEFLGKTYTEQIREKYTYQCNECKINLHTGQRLSDMEVFHFCPKCERIYK